MLLLKHTVSQLLVWYMTDLGGVLEMNASSGIGGGGVLEINP